MRRILAAVLLLAPSPCSTDSTGSSSTGSTEPVIDSTLGLWALTTAQKQELCDWEASKLGGYGVTTSCSTGSGVATPASQTACVAGFNFSANTCAATVGDEFNCVNLLAELPCQTTLTGAAECQAVISCM